MAIRLNKIKELEREGKAISIENDPVYIREKEETNKRMQEFMRKQRLIAALCWQDSDKIILNT